MNETYKMYYWDEKNQIIIEKDKADHGMGDIVEDMYCVDDYYQNRNESRYRYGIYDSKGGWMTYEYKDFPPAFQMALMLTGVES